MCTQSRSPSGWETGGHHRPFCSRHQFLQLGGGLIVLFISTSPHVDQNETSLYGGHPCFITAWTSLTPWFKGTQATHHEIPKPSAFSG